MALAAQTAHKRMLFGGDCYNYALLASGTFHLVVEAGLKLHDFAALVPVVEGAGGMMCDWNGEMLHAGSDGPCHRAWRPGADGRCDRGAGVPPLSPVGDYRFILPAPALRRYFSSYYLSYTATPGGVELDDLLYPEWASARFMLDLIIPAKLGARSGGSGPARVDDRPTSRACHVRCCYARLAGIGMLPVGWSRFVGSSASRCANAVFDVETDTGFALFGAIWQDVQRLQDHREIADLSTCTCSLRAGPEIDPGGRD